MRLESLFTTSFMHVICVMRLVESLVYHDTFMPHVTINLGRLPAARLCTFGLCGV